MKPSPRFAIALLTSAMILGLGLLAALVPPRSLPVNQRAIPEHIQEMHLQDTTRQRRAHQTVLISIAAAIAALSLSPRLRERLGRWQPGFLRSRDARRLPEAGVALFILLAALLTLQRSSWAAIGLLTAVGFVLVGAALQTTRWFRIAVGTIMFTYGVGVLLPGLLSTPDLSSSTAVPPAIVEAHYSVAVSQGDRLATGLHLFKEVMPQYGFAGPLALGLFERSRGLLDFADHVRIVQVMQIAFCATAFLCYWYWSDRRILATALVLLPIFATIHTRHISVFCPNQSGWRFSGFPVGMLVLILAAFRLRRSITAAVLGATLGALLLFNPESGVAMGVIYVTYLLSTHIRDGGSGRQLLGTFATFGSTMIVPLLLFVAIFRLSFGYLPFPRHDSGEYALSRFAAGYGGITLTFGIGWIVILTHALFEVISGALSVRELTTRRRIRISVASGLLVWFGYFFNRAVNWNLWTIYFLYGFFIIDFARAGRLVRYSSALRRGRLSIGFAIVCMFIIGNSVQVLAAAHDNLTASRHPSSGGEVLSGVRFPVWYADLVRQRADYLRRRSKQVRLYYFTGNLYLVPLMSGVFSPVGDAYEVFSTDDFERLVQRIRADGPPEILFDDSNAELTGSPERSQYYARLKVRLQPTYALGARQAGWEIWRRVDARPAETTEVLE